MFPAGINPRQMRRMMEQMGIKSEEIDAKRVIIETSNGKIIIENPQVTAIEFQGQKTFQVMGNIKEEEFSEADVMLVMEQANATREAAEKALRESQGDIAKAILSLKKD
ncbi:MAG: nascent polypeptide-associated complex protein [Candidatus Micrarchaeia archaeon]